MPSLIFDLDGTLVDTAPDLVATLNHVLAEAGYEQVETNVASRFISFGARHMIERALEHQDKSITSTRLDDLNALFLEHYIDHLSVLSAPFDGLLETLDRHQLKGFNFAVCTNKLERFSVKLLNELEMSNRFGAICGADTFGVKKPHKDHLLKTMAEINADPSSTIMIGDAEPDIKVAQNAGIPVIAVDFGYTPVPVEGFGPTRVISHYDELDQAVSQILG